MYLGVWGTILSSFQLYHLKYSYTLLTNLEIIMLYLIGLGLADETDVTVKGLELIRKAERVYLEAYTSILLVDTAKLVDYIQFEWHWLR